MNPNFDHVIILADESANWRIGGLRQLERLVLALDELAKLISSQRKIGIFVFWRPDIGPEQRWQPENSRLTRCNFVESLNVGTRERFLSTRLMVKRGGLEKLLQAPVTLEDDPSIGDELGVWEKLSRRIESACANSSVSSDNDAWRYLFSSSDIARTERWLLRSSGKTRDGFVSRFLNRSISRLITRALLRFPITPNAWTMSIFPLLIIAFFFLLRGDYSGFVVGCAIFQVYSILDGCDGEIARAKNLVSGSGGRLDTFCDTVGNLLLVIGVGLGLRVQHRSSGWIYAVEGIFCALLIAANELWLHQTQAEEELPPNRVSAALYPRHRALAQRSGLLVLGEKNVWWLVQLTKRDVAILFFLLLAIAGFPQWILHLSLLVTAITLSLSAVAMRNSRTRSQTVGGSRA